MNSEILSSIERVIKKLSFDIETKGANAEMANGFARLVNAHTRIKTSVEKKQKKELDRRKRGDRFAVKKIEGNFKADQL